MSIPGEVRSAPRSSNGAVLAGGYRYLLWRTWDDALPRLLWVMLNPSTADATTDDPTIRRCVGFSQRWGYGGLEVVNLFALCATDSRALPRAAEDPIGPENDHYLAEAARRASGIVVAWGKHGGYRGRDQAVLALLAGETVGPLQCLGVTKNSAPRHPGRLRGDVSLVPYPIGSRSGEGVTGRPASEDHLR